MIWLTWRQFRAQALTAAIGLLALGGWLLATGPGLSHEYAAGLARCHGDRCTTFTESYLTEHQDEILLLAVILIALPALLGLFWGAPLVARELDAGTHHLVWNQSVTRFRWLAVKLLGVGAASAAVAGLAAWWVTRWSDPLDHASLLDPRLDAGMIFDARGIVPVAYAVFAFAVGVTAGMVIRRVVPAMAVTLGAFLVAQFGVGYLVRPHLAPSNTSITPVGVRLHGAFRFEAGSPFWRLQWTEAGMYAAATAVLGGFCFWWLHRRAA